MYENNFPTRRYEKTLAFLQKHVDPTEKILDLGVSNPFSEILTKQGFQVSNTAGQDLDVDFGIVKSTDAQVVTAFEIFEHMLAPLNLLSAIDQPKKLLASVPLRLWFATAYRSKTDPWDRHYHEFEDWQFDWLMEKSGWVIKDRLQWAHPVQKLGIRPLLRSFTPRYYLIYAERP